MIRYYHSLVPLAAYGISDINVSRYEFLSFRIIMLSFSFSLQSRLILSLSLSQPSPLLPTSLSPSSHCSASPNLPMRKCSDKIAHLQDQSSDSTKSRTSSHSFSRISIYASILLRKEDEPEMEDECKDEEEREGGFPEQREEEGKEGSTQHITKRW